MLPLADYQRYGRQMILEGFGLPAQLKLQEASVVVVGAGGLGCPALQYLGAAGIGRLGIIDHDNVELSNLGRQILHNEETIGMPKAESAALALKRLNSHLTIDVHITALNATNAVSLLSPYDIILDCTDNAPTRYLLSDTAVALGKPLVSGAAQKFEGQLCVYNLGDDGPCYRCLYPRPPAQEMVGTCEETGILGVVTGVIGNLQALETIKIITGLHDKKPTLLLFSALGSPPFRSIKLRSRKPTCPACGTAEQRLGTIQHIDYVQFCGGPRPDWEQRGLVKGEARARASTRELEAALKSGTSINLLDVRPETEFGICALPSSINVPLNRLVANPEEYLPLDPATETYVVCRLGNDSQIAADALRSACAEERVGLVRDVVGGLKAWAREVDPGFPVY
ncbi:putative plays a central role in 2-thiolation of mcm(5)S(2)U at tRNA wobble positions of cytosolic tRNA(Lys), tRNA(Glu) and tRNA(Gln) [Lyophyllum shimeji]|uniref:Plays a central role in 2-thiolation of mcm(5)S(2)U at tRNA wobble positions of cytosolic tRNA(Lys), tRNA(Glu) and tRNA(Gln) n=1 Tax=Lyophyllum shimeji TaxID=47721 RepID=A0A9P3PMC4_LYOSH|nr:putative plays a central role in 2-thiolation of mcm(5)S(2)U at tRNA wobble positions of cytosolic tRNA(Lys), tRNA(Glu) and tRNA(Gln) [Lyophyllum shimeji]